MNDEPYFDDRKPIAHCSYCNKELKGESENFYADEFFYYDGVWACEDCKDEFLRMFRINPFI